MPSKKRRVLALFQRLQDLFISSSLLKHSNFPAVRMRSFGYVFLALMLFPDVSAAQDKKVLTFAVQDYCPFICINENEEDELSGAHVEILRALFDDSIYQVRFKSLPFLRSFREIKKGRIDGIVGILKNAERAEAMYFAGPITQSRSCFYTRDDVAWRYSGVDSLAQVKLGIVKGYLYKGEVGRYIAQNQSSFFFIPGENAESRQFSLLMSHRFDVVYESEIIAEYFLRQAGLGKRVINAGCESKLEKDYIAIAKLSPDGKAFYDDLMTKLKAPQYSATIEQILSKYGIKPTPLTN